MNAKIIQKKISGFTLIELMITIAIIAILVTLATPTSFYQQTRAVNYADRALQQAKVYSNYISDNYSTIYNSAKTAGNNVLVFVNLPSNSTYWGGLSNTDTYGNIACATVSLDTSVSGSKKLNMYMYYDNSGSGTNNNIITAANNYLSGAGGALDSTGTNFVGAFSTWSRAKSSIVMGSGSCSTTNGLAINLNSLITQTSNMQADNSLHRTSDPNNIGTSTNYNTMQTDIIMGYTPTGSSTVTYNGIYFGNTKNPATAPYLTSGKNASLTSPYNTTVESDVVAANATLVANAFMPLGTATINSTCAVADIGRIVRNAATPTSSIPQSDLICSYNTVTCGSTTPCYLSISDTSSRIRNNTVTSVTYTCSSGVIDKSVPPVLGTIVTNPNNSTNCRYTEIGPRVFTYPTTTSVSVSTTWLLVYTTLTSGTCNLTGTGITPGVSTLSGGNYAPAIAAAACTQ